MKIVFILLVLQLTSPKSYCQKASPTADDYQRKSIHQKTVARVILITSGAAFITGIIVTATTPNKGFAKLGGIAIAANAAVLSLLSIPFYRASYKNEAKADFLFKRESNQHFSKGSMNLQNYPAVAIRWRF